MNQQDRCKKIVEMAMMDIVDIFAVFLLARDENDTELYLIAEHELRCRRSEDKHS